MISDFEWEALPEGEKELVKGVVKSACRTLFTEAQSQLEQVIRSFGISRREFLKVIFDYAIERF